MTELAVSSPSHAHPAERGGRGFLRTDDAAANLIGLGFVTVAALWFEAGSSIEWLAVAPQKWAHVGDLIGQFTSRAPRYLALIATLAAIFTGAAIALGLTAWTFLRAFLVLFAATTGLYALGLWDQSAHYNLEPPLVALALGLAIANGLGTPRWLMPALRVELYIKTGIVLLGASLPLTLLLWAGPVAMGQAAIVSLVTFGVIFTLARALGIEPRFAATLGTGGAVCGVSGAIAVGGAIGARREHISMAISLVVVFAIALIFALPFAARAWHLPAGIAGAWIGTSELADAAGLAAAQAYGGFTGHDGIGGRPEDAVAAFTLMKVIGRDVWIGVWALVLSWIASVRWRTSPVGADGADAGEIWRRFPKFVLGFIAAAAIVTLIARGLDFASYRREVVPHLVTPLQALRTWVFTLAFLGIGLSTQLGELKRVGVRPLLAFSAGVLINLLLGYWLSTQVFAGFWSHLGP